MNIKLTAEEVDAISEFLPSTDDRDTENLVHDWRVLSQRVQELEERILNIAFKYPEDGTSTLSEFYQMAREVLNKHERSE